MIRAMQGFTLWGGAVVWGWTAYQISSDFGLAAEKAREVGYDVGFCFAALIIALSAMNIKSK